MPRLILLEYHHECKIQKYTRIHVKTYFVSWTTLTEDEDRSTGYIGVCHPLV